MKQRQSSINISTSLRSSFVHASTSLKVCIVSDCFELFLFGKNLSQANILLCNPTVYKKNELLSVVESKAGTPALKVLTSGWFVTLGVLGLLKIKRTPVFSLNLEKKMPCQYPILSSVPLALLEAHITYQV